MMGSSPRARVRAFLLALIAAVVILGGYLVVSDGEGGPPAESDLPLLPREFAPEAEHDHPAGGPPPSAEEIPGLNEFQERQVAEDNAETIDEQTYDTSGVLTGAAAQPARVKCHTSMNGGPRPIAAIGLGVVHVTVSRNVTGLGDINALCDFFKRVKASPNWTVDNEGNSSESVPLGRIPWTQVFYNRPACSIEFVGSTGRPREGAAEWTDAQYREGARLMAGCFAKAGIPVRRGQVEATGPDRGRIVRTGVITHQELGRPGGGHTDPGPAFDMGRYLELMRFYAAGGSRKLVKWERSHRIAHARYRAHCRGRHADRRRLCDGLVERSGTLHRLIARERARA